MVGLGLSVLLAALAPHAAASGSCQKKGAPPPSGPMGVKFIGTQPGDPCPVSGDTGDYREAVSRHQGEENRPADLPAETDHDAVAQPPQLPPGRPVYPDARPAENPNDAVEAKLPPQAVAVPAAAPRWAWPGPESPAARERRLASRKETERPGDADEDLRDAPAAVSPARLTLWAGLAKPLMMPASKADSAAPAEAKALGERDYATNILGQDAVDLPAPSVVSSAAGSAPERKTVKVEMDAAAGEWKAAADALAAAAGFEAAGENPARFVGAAKTRVVLTGTVSPERMTELLTVEGVRRVESVAAAAPSAGPGLGETRVVVGIRLEQGQSPEEALEKAGARLAETAGVRFERGAAVQKVPGTDSEVVVAAAVVPVRSMALLLGDPQVVKVAPAKAPAPAAPAGLPGWRRVLAAAAGEQRSVFLAVVLSCLGLWGPFTRARKRTRRA